MVIIVTIIRITVVIIANILVGFTDYGNLTFSSPFRCSSVDSKDSQFAADYGLPVPVVIETDEQGKERLVNSAQV